jgi:uncharacterized membrane protein
MNNILQILSIIFLPYFLIWLDSKSKIVRFFGPVILCYAGGALIGNLQLFTNPAVAEQISHISVPLAIPLLLFATDFKHWIKNAKSTVVSFILVCLSVSLMSTIFGFYFNHKITDHWKIAGMLTAVFTGGTPNMNAIGLALNVEKEVFIYMNSADMIVGGLYFFLVLSIGIKLCGLFLPTYSSQNSTPALEQNSQSEVKLKHMMLSFGTAVLVFASSLGINQLLFQTINLPFLLLIISSLGVLLSFQAPIRKMSFSAYQVGQYLLYIFCISIGSLARVDQMNFSGIYYLYFTSTVLIASVMLHLLLCWIFKIDRDTALVTNIAAVFGPPFVVPVATAMQNKDALVAGLTSGLVGYALGNYLGFSVAYLVKYFS